MIGKGSTNSSSLKLWPFAAIAVAVVIAMIMSLYSQSLQPLGGPYPCCSESSKIHRPRRPSSSKGLGNVAVITAASEKFFDRLDNFVGSMHYWEPSQHIIIYDLGLTAIQLRQISCWQDVTVIPFPFDKYPLHVRNVYNYAWKVGILDEVRRLKLPHNVSIDTAIVLDAGLEIRQPLQMLKSLLRKKGYFIATQSNFVGKKTHEDMFDILRPSSRHHYSKSWYADKPFCSGGIQAYNLHRPEYQTILKRLLPCALKDACIAPKGSGRSIHNYDQSALSIIVYDEGLSCSLDRNFFEGDITRLTLNEGDTNDVVLGLRRWKLPKPYKVHLQLQPSCTPHLPFQQRSDLGIIETTQSFRVEVDSPLQLCLWKHNNDRQKCAELIREAYAIPSSDNQVFFEQCIRWVYMLLWKTISCPRTYYLIVLGWCVRVFWLLSHPRKINKRKDGLHSL